MIKPIIYLAGPIAGCNDEEAHGWRNGTIRRFQDIYDFRNPMDRDYRGRYFNPNAIVGADLDDIKASSIVLFNCWQSSFGTSMEMVYASKIYNKGVIVVRDKPVSPWITYHATLVVPTLADAWSALDKPVWRTYHG